MAEDEEVTDFPFEGEWDQVVSHEVADADLPQLALFANRAALSPIGDGCNQYLIRNNQLLEGEDGDIGNLFALLINFQNGHPNTNGLNGVTFEVLLAMMIDRLNGFQRTSAACEENTEVLDHLQQALATLHKRTARVQVTQRG